MRVSILIFEILKRGIYLECKSNHVDVYLATLPLISYHSWWGEELRPVPISAPSPGTKSRDRIFWEIVMLKCRVGWGLGVGSNPIRLLSGEDTRGEDTADM